VGLFFGPALASLADGAGKEVGNASSLFYYVKIESDEFDDRLICQMFIQTIWADATFLQTHARDTQHW